MAGDSVVSDVSSSSPTRSLARLLIFFYLTLFLTMSASLHNGRTRRWLLQSPPVDWALRQLRELLIGALKQGPVPKHVAFVMDGNRRFARNHQIETIEGHHLGFEALARVLEVCYKSGIKVVSIYAFAIENFNRPRHEVEGLMNLAKLKLSQIAQHGDLMQRYGARIRVVGNRAMLKPDVLETIEHVEEITKNNGDAVLNVCFPYASRDEIAKAVRCTVEEYSEPVFGKERPFSENRIRRNIRSRHLSAKSGEHLMAPTPSVDSSLSPPSSGATSDTDDSGLSASSTLQPSTPTESLFSEKSELPRQGFRDPEHITAETIDSHTFFGDLPPLELLIRTSGVERFSDFMMWQAHQDTDVVFSKTMWPNFDLWSFLPILVEWQWKKRREVS